MADHYDIDTLFSNAQQRRSAVPPAEAWTRIQETLDVDATWSRINATLDAAPAKRKKGIVYFYSLCFGLAVLFTGYLLYKNGTTSDITYAQHRNLLPLPLTYGANQKTKAVADAKKQNVVAPAKTNVVSNNQSNLPRNNFTPGNNGHKNQATKNNTSGGTADVQTSPHTAGNDATLLAVNSANNPELLQQNLWINAALAEIALLKPENTKPDFATFEDTPDSIWYNSKFKPTFSVQIFGGIRNNWLLHTSNETSTPADTGLTLQNSKAFATGSLLTPVAGIGCGIQLRPRLALNASLYIFSGSGQDFTRVEAGRMVSHELRLHYSSLSISTAIRLGRKENVFHKRAYGTINTGINMSFLRRYADNMPASDSPQTLGEFKNYDAGIFAGYVYHIPLGSKLEFTPGVLWNQGLVNITRHDKETPAAFRSAFNAGFEAQIGFRYKF